MPKLPLAYRVGCLARELVHINVLDVIAALNLADDIEPLREAVTAMASGGTRSRSISRQ